MVRKIFTAITSTLDLRDCHVYGGLALIALGVGSFSIGVALIVMGAGLFYIGAKA
jgi:hypothetical protein